MTTEATTKKVAVKKTPMVKSPKTDVSTKAVKVLAVKKTEAKKVSIGTAKVKVTQMIGSIGRRHDQEATLIGLGLNKRHKSRVLEDTPSVRGMIYKVRHLLKVESAN